MTVHTPIQSRSSGLPPWALGLTVLVLLVGGVYLASNLSGENPPIIAAPSASGGSAPPGQLAQGLIAEGACQSCHGQDFSGGVGPSLLDIESGPESPNLQDLAADHPEDWAEIWIAGTEPEVSDPGMRQGMPAFGGPLYEFSAEEIAAIVDYLTTLP